MLYERTMQMKLLELKLVQFQTQFNETKIIIKENETSLQVKDHQLAKVQLELVNVSTMQDETARELRNGMGETAFDKARERETQMIKFTKKTVNSLQRQLAAKDELIFKYRDRLKTIKNVPNEDVIVAKNDLINQITKREISRFGLENEPTETKERDLIPELDLIAELEKSICAKDHALAQLILSTEEKSLENLNLIQDLEDLKIALDSSLFEKSKIIEENEEKVLFN
jgi:seryl-tRNA synthetase